jgi:hypothetical protein
MWCEDVGRVDLDQDRDEIIDHVDVSFSTCLINYHTSKEIGFGGLAPHMLNLWNPNLDPPPLDQ